MHGDTAGGPPLGVLQRLEAAASAEEFFLELGVGYDERVLNVARLHILKRMSEYLSAEEFESRSDDVIAARCKAVLARAYRDFAASSPRDQRVFKVLRNAAASARPAFVPFDTLLSGP